ncbi:MAG: hypothetical protein QOI54_2390 [Actinomycetota bacterium]|nr:hypothetical protein [Actinomycetota bacterium]
MVAARQGGVFSAADAAGCGITRARMRTLLQSRDWVRLARDALAERPVVELAGRDPRATHALQLAAALLSLRRDAAAVKISAACVWQLDLTRAVPACPLVVRPAGSRTGGRTERSVRVLRAGPPGWRLATVSGVATTDLARTVVDLARTWPHPEALIAADSALRIHGGDQLHQMHAVAAACSHWPGGGRRVAGVLADADPRSESALETLGRLAMRRDGLPPPRTQCWVGEFRPEVRTDYGWEAQNTVGEADGRVKYTSADVLWKQARREERLHDLGFAVVRFDHAGTQRPGELGDRFRRAFARARPGRGRFWPDPPGWKPGVRPADAPPFAGIAWWLWDPTQLSRLWDG